MGAEGDTTAGVSDAEVAGGVDVAGEDAGGLVELLGVEGVEAGVWKAFDKETFTCEADEVAAGVAGVCEPAVLTGVFEGFDVMADAAAGEPLVGVAGARGVDWEAVAGAAGGAVDAAGVSRGLAPAKEAATVEEARVGAGAAGDADAARTGAGEEDAVVTEGTAGVAVAVVKSAGTAAGICGGAGNTRAAVVKTASRESLISQPGQKNSKLQENIILCTLLYLYSDRKEY